MTPAKNQKSHGGKRKGSGAKKINGGTRPAMISLDVETEAKAIEIGGNISAGIRIAVKAYPNK